MPWRTSTALEMIRKAVCGVQFDATLGLRAIAARADGHIRRLFESDERKGVQP